MRVILLEDYDSKINDYVYKKGQWVDVTEIEGFENKYAVYRYKTIDWIPKKLVEVK